jgi:ribose/xylose/arabinose/galactoside ABC-type transport system permease subunit
MTKERSSTHLVERNQQLIVPVVLVIALCLLALARGPNLFTSNGIGSAIIVLAPLILAALALTPIALVGRGGVDLSVGPLLGFINVSMVKWLVGNEITHPVVIVGYVIAAGVIYQLVVATTIIYVRVAPIIVTLSGYLVLTGMNLIIMDRPSGVAPPWMQDWGSGTDILSPVFLIVGAMIVLWIVFSKTSLYQQILLTGAEERMSFANLRSMLLLAAFLGLASLGQTLCALLGGIDMSIPYVIGSANILLASLFNLRVPLVLACLVVILAGALVGTINGVLSFRVQGQSLIMTLGVGFAIVGATQILTSIGSVYAGNVLGKVPAWLRNVSSTAGNTFGLPVPACHLHLDHRVFRRHPHDESDTVWTEFLRRGGESQSGG